MKVAVICDFPFWEGRVGTAVRIESLCRSLAGICDLTVICSMPLPDRYRLQMSQAPYTLYDHGTLVEMHDRTSPQPISGVRADRQVTVKGIKQIVDNGGYDAVLTPYFNRDWMIEHIRPDVLRIVDTIDCQSQRTRSFATHGLIPTFPMTPEEEGANLDRYDMALALSDEDQDEFARLTRTPVITAPFRLPATPIYTAREHAGDVLFIAARSDVNDMTLAYMMEEVLPLVRRPLTLHVVGNVTIPDTRPDHIGLMHHQNVDDLSWIYRAVDLALNPTYAGGGIKTKTLEAMAYGVPVLTSDEGARGLRGLLPETLIVNDKETFAHQIVTLLDDRDHRNALSRQITANMQAEDTAGWLSAFDFILQSKIAQRQEQGAA